MKRKISITILAVAVLFSFSYFAYNANSEESQRGFTGTKKCKMCHNNPKSGAQFKQWESSKHAKAFEVLGTPEAKAIGTKMGIADPQKDDKCLKCHVTGHGVDAKLLDKNYAMTDGVSCESCHGAGADYWTKKVMEDVSKGTVDGASVGLITPTEEMCKTCHNPESPTFKEFNFDEMYKAVSHPIPAEYKTEKGYK